ncbi:MAG TPA: fibronectin type III domain-containing protein [Solirubrobacterales bacterium]|nr:fibronectin type III domain-containing protein [Solirubrobacterales bacterium]
MRARAVPVGAAIAAAALLATLVLAVSFLPRAGADPAPDPVSGDHLVVSQVLAQEKAQAVTLLRFDGSGAPDGAPWPLPTTTSLPNHGFTLEGNSSAVGAVARSVDRRYVTLAGYTQPVGAEVGVSGDTAPRDVARVDSLGSVDTSTTLSTNFTKVKIRGAATTDGSGFWVTGHGNESAPKGGMVYAALGSTTPTVLFTKASVSPENSALNNTRSVQIAGGDLYFGSEKGTAGVYRLSGLPTSPGVPSNLISFTGEIDPISELPLEHVSGSGTVDTMYVVKEAGGVFPAAIVKYSFNGTSWVEQGQVVSGAYGPIAGKVDPEGHFRLYVVQGSGAGNSIVTLTDTAAYNAPPVTSGTTTIVTAAAGQAFRGIAFAPEDSSLTVPGAPTGVSGVAGEGKVELSWTAPASGGGSSISGYRITPFIAGSPQTPVTSSGTGTSFTVNGLTNGAAYTFTVEAINATGPGPASDPSAAIVPHGVVISLAAAALEGSLGDPTNPTDSVSVEQPGTPPADLSVAATATSNPAVATTAGVSIAGSGATRTVTVTPAGGVGYADITLTVTGAESKTATAVLHYAVSASTGAASRWLTGSSDESTAIDVGGGYVLVGDDEENTLRLFRRDTSGAAVKSWNFDAQMGNPSEIDVEAAARAGNTIYWTGSMGNSKSGGLKPDRSILFTTTISGSGAATELSFGGYYRGLRQDLISWDEANGNRFGFAAGAAAGKIPKEIGGFNVEGLEFAPGSTATAYLAFRAPLTPATATGKALIVPVTNIAALAAGPGQNTTVHASFGEPILLDLGGLSLREIRKNAANEYLLLGGSWAAGGSYALFSWDGVPGHAPVKSTAPLPAGDSSGEDPAAWESIVAVPQPLTSGSQVQLISDNGSSFLYGDTTEAKELPYAEWKKSRVDSFEFAVPSSGGAAKTSSAATMPPSPFVNHRIKQHRKRHHKKHARKHRAKQCGSHKGKHRKAKCKGGRGAKH